MPRLTSSALVLLALLLAVGWPTESGPAPGASLLLAVPGPLSPAALQVLCRQAAFHGDFGAFGVAEAEPAGLAALGAAGLAPVALGSWPADEALLVRRAGTSGAGRVL